MTPGRRTHPVYTTPAVYCRFQMNTTHIGTPTGAPGNTLTDNVVPRATREEREETGGVAPRVYHQGLCVRGTTFSGVNPGRGSDRPSVSPSWEHTTSCSTASPPGGPGV